MATVAAMWVKVGADVRGLKKNLSEAQRTADKFATQMGKVGKRLSVLATVPILAFGAASLKTAGDFESSMNRVQAVSGATAAEFRALQKQARSLGATTQYSASQAADAMGFLAMAGLKTTEVLGAMPGTLQLAASAQIDLARSADIVTNILTGYGLQVEELSRANDVLVKTFTATNTDLTMLGESFKYVGPVAKSAGVAFEETAAAIGLMGNAGIQGSMAGTSLRGAITRLLKPTAEVSRTLARLGVSAVDSAGQLRSLTEIVRQLEESGATTGDMMAIFGQRAGPAMAALVDQGSSAIRDLVRELEGAGGTAQRIADVQMRGLRGALLELRSALEELALSITGTGLTDSVAALARQFASLTRAVAALPAPVLRTGVVVAGLVATLGPLLLIGAKITTMLLTLKAAAAAVGLTVGAIAAPVAAAVAALVALGAILLTVTTRAQKAREATQKVAEAASEAARIEAQTPEGRAKRIRELEAREQWLLGRVVSLSRSAEVSSDRMARSFRRSGKQFHAELIQVRGELGKLRRAGEEVADAFEEAAAATAGIRRGLNQTWETYDRLRDIQERALDALADLRIEEALSPGGEALEEITRKIAEMEERLRAVNREIARFDARTLERASQLAATATPGDLAQSIQRQTTVRAEPIQTTSALEKAQANFDRWLADPRITIGMLERDPEFHRAVEVLRRELDRRDKITGAVQPDNRGAMEKLMAGEVMGAIKSAFLPLLKVAAPLAVAFEFLKGLLDTVREPLQALLLPVRMLGQVVGSALLPILRALWPALKALTIAATYVLQAFFWVSGYLQKAIGWLLAAIGKAVKFLSFGLVKSIEKAGKSLQKMGDESLESARDFGRLRGELRDLSFEDALDRVTESAEKAADALLNVPQGFKVALARFRASDARSMVPDASMPPTAAMAHGAPHSVQNNVPVTIHVHANERTDVRSLVDQITREFRREAHRGGVTGLDLVIGAA